MTKKPLDVSETDLHWLAGLVEGEAWFTDNGPRVCISMKDLDVMQRVAGLFESNLSIRGAGGGKFNLGQVSTSAGKLWVKKLYPLLGARRQARIRDFWPEVV